MLRGDHGDAVDRDGATATSVGRYTILRILRSRPTSQLIVGFDSSLDRKVTIKVLRPGSVEGERTLRAAQALAKITHPNLTRVFEIGEHEGQPFIATEYVDGADLRTWLRARSRRWSEILGVVVAAGRGLAAAQALGLLHLEIRPESILVAADARVLLTGVVIDGAHARNEHAQHERDQGRDIYMSPEQLRGEPLDAHSDQFSLCVTLYESLYDQHPFAAERARLLSGDLLAPPAARGVPRRVERALRRGLAGAPDDRWCSLGALLDALDRDPARRRRGLAGAGLLTFLTAGTGYTMATVERASVVRCGDAVEALASIWSDDRRARIRAALRATDTPLVEDTLPRVEAVIDRYTDAWTELRARVCEEHQREALPSRVYELSKSCLARRQADLDALLDVLTETAPGTVENAVTAAFNLPRVATCADAESLLAATPPPANPSAAREAEALRAELSRVEALEGAGRYDDGLALLETLAPRVNELAYAPLSVAHLLGRGTMLLWIGRFEEAERVLADAYLAAIRAHEDALAGEALAQRIFVVGRLGRSQQALAWYPEAAAWAGDDDRELRALILNNTATIEADVGHLARGSAMVRESSALWTEIHGETHPQAIFSFANLAEFLARQGRCDEALDILDTALARLEQTFGSEHYAIELNRSNRCEYLACAGDLSAAVECFDGPIRELLSGGGTTRYWLDGLASVAILVHRARGDVERAAALADEIIRSLPEDKHSWLHASALQQLGELALADADLERASELLRESATLQVDAAPTDALRLQTETDLATLALARGHVDDAHARALEIIVRGEASHAEQPWLVAPARFLLARVEASAGERDAALALAERADADLVRSGHIRDYLRAEIQAWRAGAAQ
ncbi:MAG: tetratricopeptide repeat protein [Myxococcales bacterium]|nr:tetratricopeptide repeat protein [Myxococcales bacterium]